MTIRTKAFEPAESERGKGEIIPFDPGIDATKVRVELMERVKEEIIELAGENWTGA